MPHPPRWFPAWVLVVSAALVSCQQVGGETAEPTPSVSPSPSQSPPPSPSPEPEEELPTLPAFEGRVEGKFRGIGLFVGSLVFSPRCKKGGACPVVGQARRFAVKFDFKGRGYSTETRVTETCSSRGLSASFQVTIQQKFRVTRARYDEDGVWRATELSVVERVNTPGAKKTVTGATTIQTLTCEGFHQKNTSKMRLAERI